MSELETILAAKKRRGRGCYVCGDKSEAAVTVRIHKVNADGSDDFTQKTRSRSLCAEHAVAAYRDIVDRIDQR